MFDEAKRRTLNERRIETESLKKCHYYADYRYICILRSADLKPEIIYIPDTT